MPKDRNVRFSTLLAIMTIPSFVIGVSVSSRAWGDQISAARSREAQIVEPSALGKPYENAAIAKAWEGCIASHYLYNYTISAGPRQGDAWICCVPIKALLSDSFKCGGLQIPLPSLGTPNDQKVQKCLLEHPLTTTQTYIPACKRSPVSIQTTPR